MIGTTRATRLAITALLIGAAALAFDAGRTTGRASCQPIQLQPAAVVAVTVP
jgi:hypothetical protein